MSTRGLLGFAHNGELKATYNHSDSYPAWLGVQVATFLAKHRDNMASVETQVDALVMVDDDEKPTKAQVAKLAQYTDTSVGGVTTIVDGELVVDDSINWYQVLRDTQGEPEKALEAGFMIDGADFALDSLFCEWGYVIDLDQERLEIYQGFQKKPVTKGRWAGQKAEDQTYPNGGPSIGNQYYPIGLLVAIPFRDIPTDPGAIGLLMGTIEDQQSRMDSEYLEDGDEPTTPETLAIAIEQVLALTDGVTNTTEKEA